MTRIGLYAFHDRAPDSALATLWCPAPNREPRRDGRVADMLVLHYTGMESAEAALDWLTRQKSRRSRAIISSMTRGASRRWCASPNAPGMPGRACGPERPISIPARSASRSTIPGHEFGYVEFPDAQLQAVEALCLDILSRHPIRPERVVAHSDIAPGRRDPGEKFDWARLARAGVGLWVAPAPLGEDPGWAPATKARCARS